MAMNPYPESPVPVRVESPARFRCGEYDSTATRAEEPLLDSAFCTRVSGKRVMMVPFRGIETVDGR